MSEKKNLPYIPFPDHSPFRPDLPIIKSRTNGHIPPFENNSSRSGVTTRAGKIGIGILLVTGVAIGVALFSSR